MASRPILIAATDGDPFVSQLVKTLRTEGREVLVSRRLGGAARMARARRPAVIVLDTVLQDGDGLALCRRLKENPETREIPIFCFSVVMSRDRCVEAGADGFMLKPLEQDLLLERVRHILDGRVMLMPSRPR